MTMEYPELLSCLKVAEIVDNGVIDDDAILSMYELSYPPSPISYDLPISRVPSEILQQIFIYCLPAYPPEEKHIGFEAPLLLTHICSAWRSIALDMPRLWTTFHLTFDSQSRAPDSNSLTQASLWLQRSKTFPLILSISLSASAPLFLIQGNISFHLKRVKELNISMSLPLLQRLFHVLPPTMPLLESLSIRVKDGVARLDGADPTAFFNLSLAPRLCHLSLRTSSWMDFGLVRSSMIRVPWSRLTTLDLCELKIHFTKARKILTQCLNLRECYLSVGELSESISPLDRVRPRDKTTATLGELRVMKIKYTGCSSIQTGLVSWLFQPLTLPKLQDLDIKAVAPDRQDKHLIRTLYEMHSRSPFNLIRLRIASVLVNIGHLIEFLDRLQSLRSLHLECSPGRSHGYIPVLSRLVRAAPKFLPRIQCLHIIDSLDMCPVIKNPHDCGIFDESSLDTLVARWLVEEDNYNDFDPDSGPRDAEVYVLWLDSRPVNKRSPEDRRLEFGAEGHVPAFLSAKF